MYYLQSRYYYATAGRFINADDPQIALETKEETDGTNLFAYCCNDPVNNVDHTGFRKYKKIKWLKNYVKTGTVADLIDIAIAIISPAVSASYDATGFVLKKVFKKYGEKSAEKYFVKNIKPVIKSTVSKFGNKICRAIIKVTGRAIDAIHGSLINKFLSLIPKALDYICRVNYSKFIDIIFLWTSIGGVIAFLLDFIPSLRYDGRIYKKDLFR